MTDLGELALKLGGWLSLAKDDGVFVGGSNNTYIYGDASNVQIQQGPEGCKQIGVEGKCPDAVKLLLELEENEQICSLLGEKAKRCSLTPRLQLARRTLVGDEPYAK